MTLPLYLAMTAAEFAASSTLPPKIGWLGCHFSSAHRGISNLPKELPEGSLLILDDWMPINGHDPLTVAKQLEEGVKQWNCCGVLLDFQRQDSEELAALCDYLAKALPCPVAVTEFYAKDLSCTVFLSAPALRVPLKDQAKPWQGRELWLEAALDGEKVVITEEGSKVLAWDAEKLPQPWHKDKMLHCRYHWGQVDSTVQFLIQRTKEDLLELLEEAHGAGVTRAVGLYQQLK